MSDEKYSKIKFILKIIQTAGIIIAVLSLLLSYISLNAQHDWNRRHQAFILINETYRQIAEQRKELKQSFPELYQSGETKHLSKYEAENLYNACSKENPKHAGCHIYQCDDRGIACKYLNLMEYISVAYINNVVDQHMIDVSLGGTMIEDYDYFENFIKQVGIEKSRSAWAPFKMTVDQMKKKKIPVLKTRWP
jgi:hypothetical protein